MKRRLLCACFAVFLFLAGCRADISAYENQAIQISGLTEEDFTVTPRELAEMKCVSATATGNSAKAGTVNAYGPTLATFVGLYGKSMDELESVRFLAGDDYDVLLGPVTWKDHDVIFSISNGGDPLEASQQPLRIVIPGVNSGKWVRMVTRIEFTCQ
ncbi:MAG: hypothetical protein VB055_09545 [Oscillospiraceae bacterium]|nr:hypothetical protein [Oscillospiraceae bacterium]